MKKTSLFKLLPILLMLFAFGYENAQAADSEESTDLKAQQPTMETQVPAVVVPLQGGVTKTGSVQDTNLQGQVGKASLSADDLKARIEALSHKHKLSSEEYRNLEFGITGFISTKFVLSAHPVVTKLFPGCPAEQVGLRLGDRLIKANDHAFTWRDMQRQYWRYLDGRAGTSVDLSVLRKGELLTFRITLMNIEDIPDERLRRLFERMVRTLGAPGQDGMSQ